MNKFKKASLYIVVIATILIVVIGLTFLLKKRNSQMIKEIGESEPAADSAEQENLLSQYNTTDFTEVKEAAASFKIKKYGSYSIVSSPGYDNPYSIHKTRDGGYILSGWTKGFGAGDYDFLLQKYDNDNNLVWSKAIGGKSNDCAYSAIETSDGGFIVSGCATSFTKGDFDAVIQKFDLNGNLTWSRTAGGKRNDHYYKAIETEDNNFLAVGDSASFTGDDYDLLISKYAQNGDLVWTKVYGTNDNEHLFSIQRGEGGRLVATGCSIDPTRNTFNSFFLLLDQDGSIQWSKRNDLSEDNCLFALDSTTDNNYIAVGHIFNKDKNNYDALIEKFDVEGKVLWEKAVGDKDEEYALAVTEDSSGNYIVAGGSKNLDNENRQVFLGSFSQNGSYLWSKKLNTISSEAIAESADILNDGTGVIAGYILNPETNDYDILISNINQFNKPEADNLANSQLNIRDPGKEIQDFLIQSQNLNLSSLSNPDYINSEVNVQKNYKQANIKPYNDTLPKRKIFERIAPFDPNR